jgi:hypothetical protein
MTRNVIAPFVPRKKQALARSIAACECPSEGYPLLSAICVFAWLPTSVLESVVLTEIAVLHEDLAAISLRALPCDFARFVEAVHMLLPIGSFAK